MSRKISNYENFAQLSGDHNRRRYTVERTESSVSSASSKIEHGQFVDLFLSVLKWVTAGLLFSVVVFCVVASKICLLVLGQQFKSVNQTKTSSLREASVKTSKQASILMLVLVVMIPQVASLVYATWTNLRRKSRPWPTKQGFLLVSSNDLIVLFLFDTECIGFIFWLNANASLDRWTSLSVLFSHACYHFEMHSKTIIVRDRTLALNA